MTNTGPELQMLQAVSQIVAAFVSKNSVPTGEVPALINTVHQALSSLGKPEQQSAAVVAPAVPVKKSVTDDYLICLEDGKKFKSLKRHLRTHYRMTPEQYREKWKLPPDYPMVAPNYAVQRSQLAKRMGLGSQRRQKTP